MVSPRLGNRESTRDIEGREEVEVGAAGSGFLRRAVDEDYRFLVCEASLNCFVGGSFFAAA